jgi:hypothetical protein
MWVSCRCLVSPAVVKFCAPPFAGLLGHTIIRERLLGRPGISLGLQSFSVLFGWTRVFSKANVLTMVGAIVYILPIIGQSATVQPCDGAFHDSSVDQSFKIFALIATTNNFCVKLRQPFLTSRCKMDPASSLAMNIAYNIGNFQSALPRIIIYRHDLGRLSGEPWRQAVDRRNRPIYVFCLLIYPDKTYADQLPYCCFRQLSQFSRFDHR